MTGVLGYPRTRGTIVPRDVLKRLVKAGVVPEDAAHAYAMNCDPGSISAHPMITPLDAVPPAAIRNDYPAEAAQAYQLVWDATLAHLEPPVNLHVRRAAYSALPWNLVTGWVATGVGEYAFLTDALGSSADLPWASEAPGDIPEADIDGLEAESYVEPNDRHGLDALLGWADEHRVASPANLAGLIDGAIGQGWVVLAADGQMRITDAGRQLLDVASYVGLDTLTGDRLGEWRALCDGYVSGYGSFTELCAASCQSLGLNTEIPVAAIEALVMDGQSSIAAYALRQEIGLASVGPDYPSAMDPEKILSPDDPLRWEREGLERSLMADRAYVWQFMPATERTAVRAGALIAARDPAEWGHFMQSLRFDVRLRWLVGLGPNDTVPTIDRVCAAYGSWQNRSEIA